MTQRSSGLPAATDVDKPVLLLISPGHRRYREYLFPTLAQRFRIHLLNTVEPSWELPYIAGFTLVASTELDDLLPAAVEVSNRGGLAGVLSWDEARIHQAAQIATVLDLPTTDPDLVWRCRDKYQARTALAAAGVAQPRFALVSDLTQALAAAEVIGYPVVLKPRAAAASFGVVRVADRTALTTHFGFTAAARVPHMPSYEQGVLVEECLDDPEISIDSAVFDGKVFPAFVAHKQLGFAPYFEETGHVVRQVDPLVDDQAVLTALQDAHAALGFTLGWTHTEFKLTADGPKVIEVNGRLGGDLIPYLGMRASGIDPGVTAAMMACGLPPQMNADRKLIGAVRFYYPPHDDTVIDYLRFEETGFGSVLDSTVILAEPGSVVSPPPKGIATGRIAYATATAATESECRQALDAAHAALRLIERDKVETR